MISLNNAPQYGPYTLCGWRVESAFQLPELTAWSGAQGWNAEAAIRIELRELSPDDTVAGFCADGEGCVSLRVQGVAGFRINPLADRVTVQPEEGVNPLLLRGYLFGSVLAILCYRRGLFPLHGSCVLLDGEAIVFSGASGAGKSTLATALARRGHPLLCDDVCAIDLSNPRKPMLRPSFPRVKLLPDAIEWFQLGAAVTYSPAAHGAKGHFGVAGVQTFEVVQRPVPLAAIYALNTPAGDSVRRSLHGGISAFAFVESQAHRGWMCRNIGLHNQLFGHIAALAAAVPVYRLDRPCALDRMDEVARFLEAAHNAVPMPI